MAFTARTRAAIAAEFLSFWSALYAAATTPRVLLTAPGSDADLEAQVVGVELEGVEAAAAQVALDILPDQASPDALERFSYVYNVPRSTGSPASLTLQVTGAAPSTTYPIPSGTQVASADGVLFDVLDTGVTTDSSSEAEVAVRATDAGTAGNLAADDTVSFTVAPSGLNPTAVVVEVVSEGTDAEDNPALASRIISRLRERPASGNRADVRAWVLSYVGTPIVETYVYALLQPPASSPGAGTEGVLGCWTALAVGPAQGDDTENTRVVPSVGSRTPGGLLLEVLGYLLGTRDAEGAGTLTGERLPPVTMAVGDWVVEAIAEQTQNVQVTIIPTASNAFSFPYADSPGVSGTSDATHVIVSGNFSSSGTLDLSGLSALVYVGTASDGIRGGYARTTLGTGSYNGGTGLTTFPVATLPRAPITPSLLYPACPAWSALRTAVFAYFDGLGPGDTSTPSRWPTEDTAGRSTLYRTALGGLMTEVAGVLSATVTTPATDVAPAAKTVVALGTFLVIAA